MMTQYNHNLSGPSNMLNVFGVTLGGMLLTPKEFYPYLPFFIVHYWRGMYGTVEVEITNVREDYIKSSSYREEAITHNRESLNDQLVFNGIITDLNQMFVDTFSTQQFPFVPQSITDLEAFLEAHERFSEPELTFITDIQRTHFGHICQLLCLFVLIASGTVFADQTTLNKIALLRISARTDYLGLDGHVDNSDLQRPIPGYFSHGVKDLLDEKFYPFPNPIDINLKEVLSQWTYGEVIYGNSLPLSGGKFHETSGGQR